MGLAYQGGEFMSAGDEDQRTQAPESHAEARTQEGGKITTPRSTPILPQGGGRKGARGYMQSREPAVKRLIEEQGLLGRTRTPRTHFISYPVFYHITFPSPSHYTRYPDRRPMGPATRAIRSRGPHPVRPPLVIVNYLYRSCFRSGIDGSAPRPCHSQR